MGTSRTIFISDIHLQEDHPAISRQFLQLLKTCRDRKDTLYILGDLFEVWIGDDEVTAFHTEIITALKATTLAGCEIYFIHGNRDFLISNNFLAATGCRLLPEETLINLNDTPVLLMHGDTLCTQDIGYQKIRKILRNKLIQSLFLALPLFLRKRIANMMRAKSLQYTQIAAKDVMDVFQPEVERVMKKHGTKIVIHGHTHRPAFHEFSINELPALRIVLGAWHEKGNFLEWDSTGNKNWRELEANENH